MCTNGKSVENNHQEKDSGKDNGFDFKKELAEYYKEWGKEPPKEYKEAWKNEQLVPKDELRKCIKKFAEKSKLLKTKDGQKNMKEYLEYLRRKKSTSDLVADNTLFPLLSALISVLFTTLVMLISDDKLGDGLIIIWSVIVILILIISICFSYLCRNCVKQKDCFYEDYISILSERLEKLEKQESNHTEQFEQT